MIKKTLSHSVKVLKFSTWVSAILALIIVLISAFFVAFPVLVKAPIENQMSELSELEVKLDKIGIDFDRGDLVFNLYNLRINSPQQNTPIAFADQLKWDVNLTSLLDDIYHPSEISIDTLVLYSQANQPTREFGVAQLRELLSSKNLELLSFFKSLSIEKTIVKGAQQIELSQMVLSRDQTQLTLKITNQDLSFGAPEGDMHSADIVATLSTTQAENDQLLTIPFVVSNDVFSVQSHLKLYQKEQDDLVEINSYIARMKAVDVAKNLPPGLLGETTKAWIKRGFKAGELTNMHFQMVKDLATTQTLENHFSAQLNAMELLFNSDWDSLKQLNAHLTVNDKTIKVDVNNTRLYDFLLEDITVQILDLSQDQLDVEVLGKINSQSEQLTAFLKRAPMGETVDEVLEQFTLTGRAEGEIDLVIPLDERASDLTIDLVLLDNRLSTLKGAIVVEDYNTKLSYRNNQISANGVGSIRQTPFDIRINPNNRGDDIESNFRVELVHNNSGFQTYITKRLDQSWRVNLNAETVQGNISIMPNEGGTPTVSILGLHVSNVDAIKGQWNITPADLTDMNLIAKDIFVDETTIANFTAQLSVESPLLRINNLEFEGIGEGDDGLSFNGFWVDGRTRLYANANGKSLENFLHKLQIKEKISGGEFDFDIRLSCECTPWNMNYGNITGYADMQVKQGIFTEKDPSLGRLLSLLNIKSIAKRLKLDMSDLVQKGFAYEDIDAKLSISDALAKIDYFKLNATSGVITLKGNSNLVEQEYDLMAKVSPAVGDAVPAAAALAGGGAIGLGIWLADETLFAGKLIDKIFDKVVDFKYKITGPWDAPIIKNVSSVL